MPISPYIASVRASLGSTRLLLPSVTGIIFDANGSILLLRHRDGDVWSTPGGAIEPDETPADAVVREVQEETGLIVRPDRILGVFGGPSFVVRYSNGDETQYVMTVFDCAVLGGTLRPVTDEIVELRFIAKNELGDLELSPWVGEVLPLLYDRPSQALFRPAQS